MKPPLLYFDGKNCKPRYLLSVVFDTQIIALLRHICHIFTCFLPTLRIFLLHCLALFYLRFDDYILWHLYMFNYKKCCCKLWGEGRFFIIISDSQKSNFVYLNQRALWSNMTFFLHRITAIPGLPGSCDSSALLALI